MNPSDQRPSGSESHSKPTDSDPFSRYSRQTRFAPFGDEGQNLLSGRRALICGCGALGSAISELLVRAGIGSIRIVDRDWVELSNLQRQTLFHEQDAHNSTPKAVAAKHALQQINSQVEIEAHIDDVSFETIESLGRDCDIVLDGTDNFETRFLINDFCLSHRIPWVHGGCLGAGGQVLSILPGETACFRCLVPDLPPREVLETCDSAGVLGPAIGIIASWQAAEALKILSGNLEAVSRELVVIDCWNVDCRTIRLKPTPKCPACGQGEYPFLEGKIRTEAKVLCGKNAVQLESPAASSTTLDELAVRLDGVGEIRQNAYFLRIRLPDHVVTIFRGGRTVVEGTTNEAEAKTVLAKTIGS